MCKILRRTQRHVLQIPVSENGMKTRFYGTIINMSEDGLCYLRPLVADEKRPKVVDLSFCAFDQMSSIKLSGRIVHELELEDLLLTGVEFEHLTISEKEHLKEQILRFESPHTVYSYLYKEMIFK
ncbi:MAG: PilZ domain-containing protein [Desulfotalea sp.]